MKPIAVHIVVTSMLAMAALAPPITGGEHRSRQVRARDLHGTSRGESRETTVIEALPSLYVDAVVVNGEGRPIRGLTRDDFTLRENGVIQEIIAFEAVVNASAGDDQSNQDDVIRRGRRMVVVIDEAHLSPAGAEAARTAIARLVESELRDGDEISFVPTDRGAWWDARMPVEREDALAVIRRLQGRPELAALHRLSEHEAARILAEGRLIGADKRIGGPIKERTPLLGMAKTVTKPDTALTMWERVKRRLLNANLCELYCDDQINALANEVLNGSTRRTRQTLSAFKQAVEHLAAHRGRKTLVLVSEGFVRNPDVVEEIDQALEAANQAKVAVYFLDMSVLESSPPSLAERNRVLDSPDDTTLEIMGNAMKTAGAGILARETGGFYLRNGGDLEAGLARIANEAGNYYLMGYIPRSLGRRDRKLKIEVRREGALVRARKMFLAEPEQCAQRRNRNERAAVSALSTEKNRLGLRMGAFVMDEHSPGNALILVASAIESNVTTRKIVLHAEVTNRDTGEVFEFEKTLKPTRPVTGDMPIVQFHLPAGIYKSRIIVREKDGLKQDRASRRFEVPRIDGWRVTTPILTDTLCKGRPVPVARRAFPIGSRLYFHIQVLGRNSDRRSPVTSGYLLFGPDGTLVRWSKLTPITPDSNGQITRLVGLMLKGYPAGEYNLVLVVEDEASGQIRELHERFTLVVRKSLATMAI